MIDYFLNFLRELRDKFLIWRSIKAGLQIGQDVRIMDKPLFGPEPFLIKIGNHVTIAPGVRYITHDGATFVFRDMPEYKNMQRHDTIAIRDNCFIGSDAILLPGITIGPNAVVGAGAVVTKSVPPDTVVGGCPAKYICTFEEYIRRVLPKCHYCPPDVIEDDTKRRSFLVSALKAERGEDIFNLPE
jgi:acetyltransferase-like isoleucine patch superfamily enzyme